MKTILLLSLLFMACSGPRGPMGPEGDPGVVDTLKGVACTYFQQDGTIPASEGAGYWLIRTGVSLFDSCLITVVVKPVSAAFWQEPQWEIYYDGDGIRIYETAECGAGYMYRVSVVYW